MTTVVPLHSGVAEFNRYEYVLGLTWSRRRGKVRILFLLVPSVVHQTFAVANVVIKIGIRRVIPKLV